MLGFLGILKSPKGIMYGLILATLLGGGIYVYKMGRTSVITRILEDSLAAVGVRDKVEDDLERTSDSDLELLLRNWLRD